MSTNAKLSERQWFKIRAFLRAHPRVYVGKEANCRLFVEAVYWVMRTGAQWRFLPRSMAIGIVSINGMAAGATTMSGRRCINISLTTPTWKT